MTILTLWFLTFPALSKKLLLLQHTVQTYHKSCNESLVSLGYSMTCKVSQDFCRALPWNSSISALLVLRMWKELLRQQLYCGLLWNTSLNTPPAIETCNYGLRGSLPRIKWSEKGWKSHQVILKFSVTDTAKYKRPAPVKTRQRNNQKRINRNKH